MTEQDLFGLLKRCLGSQLDELTVRLDLDSSSLPGKNEALATRASEILTLAKQRPDGLVQLASLLTTMFRLSQPSRGTPQPRPAQRQTILVLFSNPIGTSRLDLDAEVTAIRSALDESPSGAQYCVEAVLTANPQEISRYLLQHEPTLVHFSGHGSNDGQILMQDEQGRVAVVDPKALARLFDVLGNTVKCILLNACYSYTHAEFLSRSVPCVIGMSFAVGDHSAIEFARGFYRALSFGKSFEKAFEVGCSQIDILSLPDRLVPRIRIGDTERAGKVIRA